MAMWAITDYNYQINDYYESYFPGDQYQALIAISFVELASYIVAGIIFESMKVKRCTKLYVLAYSIGIVGAVGILLNNEQENPELDLFFNYVAKFGIGSAFQAVYLANVLFPIVFSSTTFGLCCMMASTASFFSIWEIYDFDDKQPWVVFVILSAVGIIFALL